jgi:hypothetical protein
LELTFFPAPILKTHFLHLLESLPINEFRQYIAIQWSPTGKACGTSMKYPPTPIGAETLQCKYPGFGGLSANTGIRRSINPRA